MAEFAASILKRDAGIPVCDQCKNEIIQQARCQLRSMVQAALGYRFFGQHLPLVLGIHGLCNPSNFRAALISALSRSTVGAAAAPRPVSSLKSRSASSCVQWFRPPWGIVFSASICRWCWVSMDYAIHRISGPP